jgi:drug/metabolite transporter (DMT)-like permease
VDIQALFFIILLGSLFGGATISSRFCVGQFDPITYSGLRITLAAAGYALFYVLRIGGRRWPRDRTLWKHAAVTGILGNAIPMILIVSSLRYLSSGVTSTMITIFPVIVVVLAHYLLPDERLSLRKVAGVLLSLSGAFLIVALGETGLPDISQANPLGYIMIFTAAIFSGFTTIYVRKNLVGYKALEVTSLRLLFGALFTLPFALLMEPFDLSRVTPVGWGVFLIATLIMFFGFFLGFYIIQRFGVTTSAMVDYIAPVIASLGGAWLLHEAITTGMLAGMVLILGGVAIINYRKTRLQIDPGQPEPEQV